MHAGKRWMFLCFIGFGLSATAGLSRRMRSFHLRQMHFTWTDFRAAGIAISLQQWVHYFLN
jgi:hypothetical protein